MKEGLLIEELLVNLPQNIENMQLPAPELVNYWRLAEKRMFYIDYEINEGVLEIQKSIININIEDKDIESSERNPIIIFLDTPGGLLVETMSLAQTMIMSKTPVITVNMGTAYSGGAMLLMAGHKRYALKYSKAMIHTGSTTGLCGTYEQTEAAQKLYRTQINEMGQFILERSSIDDKTFKRNKAKDWYMTEEEQVQYGIVNKVLESLDEII